MKNKNLSWFAALLVFALLLWCTAATPGKIADPSTYTCAVYSTIFSLLPPVIAIVLALNTKEVYTSLLVGIASGALLYANGNLELAINTLFFNEDGGMVAKLSDSSTVSIREGISLFDSASDTQMVENSQAVSTETTGTEAVFDTQLEESEGSVSEDDLLEASTEEESGPVFQFDEDSNSGQEKDSEFSQIYTYIIYQ